MGILVLFFLFSKLLTLIIVLDLQISYKNSVERSHIYTTLFGIYTHIYIFDMYLYVKIDMRSY